VWVGQCIPAPPPLWQTIPPEQNSTGSSSVSWQSCLRVACSVNCSLFLTWTLKINSFLLIRSAWISRHTRNTLSPSLVESRKQRASSFKRHSPWCVLLSNTALSSANSFYQSRLTQTKLIISLYTASRCRTLAVTLQLYAKSLKAAYFAISKKMTSFVYSVIFCQC